MKKNVLALALVLALCLGLGIPSSAVEEPTEIHWLPEGISFNFLSVKDPSGGDSQLFYLDGLEGDNSSSTLISVKQKVQEYKYKYGFADATGKIVIPLEYDDVSNFSEGLAAVRKDDKWGYINPTGKVVIPFEYDSAGDFSEGLAEVWIGDWETGKYGYIDTTGNLAIPCQYGDADKFSNGLARVQIGDGRIGKYGLIDTTGNEVIPCQYDMIYDFSEGLALIRVGDWENEKYGYIDTTGNIIISCEYDDASNFSEGLAVVKIGDWETGKYGYIDKTGKVVIPFEYDSAFDFSDGLALVRNGDGETGKYGYIDKTGKVVIPFEYDDASYFSEGLASVKIGDWETGKYGYIDKTGKVVIPLEYDNAYTFSGGYAEVYKNGESEYIDKAGNNIAGSITDILSTCDDVMQFSDGLTMIVKGGEINFEEGEGGKVGYIKGDNVIVPAIYDFVSFFGPYVCVAENGRHGIYLNPYYSINLEQPANGTAYTSTQTVLIDGKPVEFQAYALRDANGGDTNYIKLRDVAYALNGTAAQFEVGWDGAVNIETGKPYTPTGTEMSTPFSGDRAYTASNAETRVNGQPAALDAIVLTDDNGGAYTYYKLRDLGTALGFTVDWSAEMGITIQTK